MDSFGTVSRRSAAAKGYPKAVVDTQRNETNKSARFSVNGRRSPKKSSGRSALSIAIQVLIVLCLIWMTCVAYLILKQRSSDVGETTVDSSLTPKEAKKSVRNHFRRDGRKPIEHGDTSNNGKGWTFNQNQALQVQKLLERQENRKSLVLTAYVETPPIAPRNNENDVESEYPPVRRLPLRTHTPSDLQRYTYPALQTCNDLPRNFPTTHPNSLNAETYVNVNNKKPIFPVRYDYAKYCPVDADPFLPWIHDVFPNAEGTFIEFIAHNKRRCNGGRQFKEDKDNLQAQASLMQPVPVKRVDNDLVEALAPELWQDEGKNTNTNQNVTRYKLATSYEEADDDAQLTRFICRFHTQTIQSNGADDEILQSTIIAETLSVYPYNYEYVNYRKKGRSPSMLTIKGGPHDNQAFWNAALHFRCPVPPQLQTLIKNGHSVVEDVPSLYVDVVPIRTDPRFGTANAFFKKGMLDPKEKVDGKFDANKAWGEGNIMPLVEASGRWANIPICRPHPQTNEASDVDPGSNSGNNNALELPLPATDDKPREKHTAVACLWASSTYTVRGKNPADSSDTSTNNRLKEWLLYNKMVGLDHVYIYDNSLAHTDDPASSLKSVTDMFPPSFVTRIEWPSRVCNNNIPAHENTGERSSQYMAEASCRVRYGNSTEWMIAFDTDEFLVPMGKFDSLKDMLGAVKDETQILSFKSTKAFVNSEFMEPYNDNSKEQHCTIEKGGKKESLCLQKKADALYLETYNCDREALPKPQWAERAKKQLFRPQYVLNHYVHYSTATKGFLETWEDAKSKGRGWNQQFSERKPVERFANDVKEAFMIHAKTTKASDTKNWRKFCDAKYKNSGQPKDKCTVGFPYPHSDMGIGLNPKKPPVGETENGMNLNCYSSDRVTNIWIPRVKKGLDILSRNNRITVEDFSMIMSKSL